MAKEITAVIKLQVPGGQANPAPPIGPTLGQHGVNIMEFCKQFNAKTQKQQGELLRVELTIYKDRSFSMVIKPPPASVLLMKAAKVQKGSATPNRDKVGSVTKTQVREIAQIKLSEMNCYDVETAMRIVEGTARNMGIEVKG